MMHLTAGSTRHGALRMPRCRYYVPAASVAERTRDFQMQSLMVYAITASLTGCGLCWGRYRLALSSMAAHPDITSSKLSPSNNMPSSSILS